MSGLDEVLTLSEAAEENGKTPQAYKKAAQRGTLEARKVVIAGRRKVWITTRQAVSEYEGTHALTMPEIGRIGGLVTQERRRAREAEAKKKRR